MNSHLTSWLMICAALGLLLLVARLEIILITGPVSLLVALLTTDRGSLRQRRMLSEK